MTFKEQYEYLMGQSFENAQRFCKSQGIGLRRYNSNSLITADFKADRLNVETDTDDKIIRIVGIG